MENIPTFAEKDSESILAAVREHYASRAVQGDSCCGDGCGCSSEVGFYSPEETVLLPDDVATFSLGCGNAVGGANLKPGETVVDLGSGGGLECFIAARAVGETGRVIGIDMTPEMLARARAAADRMGVINVEFREGFIESLPIETGSVDVIISNCVINLSPNKAAVIAEMHRVLKPGGRLAISDVVAGNGVQGMARDDMDLWSSCASGALSTADWEAGLLNAGFEMVGIAARQGDDSWSHVIPDAELYSALITGVKKDPASQRFSETQTHIPAESLNR